MRTAEHHGTLRRPDTDRLGLDRFPEHWQTMARVLPALLMACLACVSTIPPSLAPAEEASGQVKTLSADPPAVSYYTYKVIKAYPHDPRAFTQGLVYEDGFLYEGTGLYGQSALTKHELETGKLIKRERLPRKYFGEGITIIGDKAIQLTWKSRTGFIYDKKTFRALDEFAYRTQGWGITHDDKHLILSNGTSTLRLLDPNTYAETRRLEVRDRGRRIRGLNELEFINGNIFANVMPTDHIVIISPQTGRVTGWINLTGLCPLPRSRPSNAVLNGIAYIPETKHLLVTGKLWPKLYEIELVEQSPGEPQR